jgi:hypothetical protein
MRIVHFFTAFSLVLGFYLVFLVTDADLRGTDFGLRMLKVIGSSIEFFSPANSSNEMEFENSGPVITVKVIYQFIFMCAFGCGLLVIALSSLARFKFGINKLYPASMVAGVCLCYIAFERGLYIGIFQYS